MDRLSYAQQPRALKAYLGLTDLQLMQMANAGEQAHKAAQVKDKALEQHLEQKHRDLQELLSKGNADATTVGKALLEVRATEKQMDAVAESARNGVLAILTTEQRTKFKNIEDAALLPEAAREAMRMG